MKAFSSAGFVNIWNNLPNSVVDVNTVDALKANLDKFWSHQVVKFYFTAESDWYRKPIAGSHKVITFL